VVQAFLAAGGVAPTPVRLHDLEARLAGADAAALGQAAFADSLTALLDRHVAPISDVRGSAWYKRETLARCVRRMLDAVQDFAACGAPAH